MRRLTTEEVAAYDLIPSELAKRVRLIHVRDLPGPYVGMSLGRNLFLAKSVPNDGSSLLVAHELVHSRQWVELGMAGFIFHYLNDFLRGLFTYRSWQKAYLAIEAEQEARSLSERWFLARTDPSDRTDRLNGH